jgi:hypothetical protein
MKRYKTIIHFNKFGATKDKPWTIHYKNACYLVSKLVCKVPMTSEWKPNKKTNPRAFFTAQISNLEIFKDNKAILS